MVIWWRKTPQSVCWNTRSWYSNTNTHTFSHSEMIIQCIHYTRWRLAWGKQLLIASNSLQFVWDHLSSLLCFSVVALWKPIGWQLMYGLLQSPQPGPRDPATTLSPHLRSISSSFAPVLSYYFPGLFSASQCVFFFFFFRSRQCCPHLPGVFCQFITGRSRSEGTSNCVHTCAEGWVPKVVLMLLITW